MSETPAASASEPPESVTIGVVLYTPRALSVDELGRESRHAADLAAKLGVPTERAFGQAIARLVPMDTWRLVRARLRLDAATDLVASVHFFAERPDPAAVAGALAVFAHGWLYRREHGAEPPGSLPLADMPPGPFAQVTTLRDAAPVVNALMLDDREHGAWMRAFEAAWDADEPTA
jgi:hypothetical protein